MNPFKNPSHVHLLLYYRAIYNILLWNYYEHTVGCVTWHILMREYGWIVHKQIGSFFSFVVTRQVFVLSFEQSY